MGSGLVAQRKRAATSVFGGKVGMGEVLPIETTMESPESIANDIFGGDVDVGSGMSSAAAADRLIEAPDYSEGDGESIFGNAVTEMAGFGAMDRPIGRPRGRGGRCAVGYRRGRGGKCVPAGMNGLGDGVVFPMFEAGAPGSNNTLLYVGGAVVVGGLLWFMLKK